MAPQLGALTYFLEDPALIPISQMTAFPVLELLFLIMLYLPGFCGYSIVDARVYGTRAKSH